MLPISQRYPWGWTPEARAVLVVVAMAGSICLLCMAPTVDQPAKIPTQLIVDPNTARAEVLVALPKLGPALVSRIVAAREKAPFRSVDELKGRVRGIGPATLESLRPHLRIETAEAEGDLSSIPTAVGESPNER